MTLLNAFGNTPEGSQPLLTDKAVNALLLYAKRTRAECANMGLPPEDVLYKIRCTPFVPYAGDKVRKLIYETFWVNVPETENHVLMINVPGEPVDPQQPTTRPGAPGHSRPEPHGTELEQALLSILGSRCAP
ncbi:hypothetical protein BE20_00390 [Sorangium cellulosum]|nr:hypothetical protein BE20_00390 [Sorangium cellulosum]